MRKQENETLVLLVLQPGPLPGGGSGDTER